VQFLGEWKSAQGAHSNADFFVVGMSSRACAVSRGVEKRAGRALQRRFFCGGNVVTSLEVFSVRFLKKILNYFFANESHIVFLKRFHYNLHMSN